METQVSRKVGESMAWVETATGIAIPAPIMGSGGTTISTLVSDGRNTAGTFIGTPIGDDKLKVEMSFPKLTPAEMAAFLRLFDRKQGGHFVNTFRIFDPRENDFVYMDMYVGDRSGRPLLVNQSTFRPDAWADVKANLIQT